MSGTVSHKYDSGRKALFCQLDLEIKSGGVQTGYENDFEVEVAPPELQAPSMYQVILMNDDFTPMDFVIQVLEQFFSHSQESATGVMLQVHHQGRGVCGIYTRDIAETKVACVNEFSRRNQHPLLCTMEKVEG